MKLCVVLLLLLGVDNDIKHVRELYAKAAYTEDATNQLMNYLADKKELSPLLLGYKGSATALLAKYSINPYRKVKYFNAGVVLLEKSIKLEPNNLELRYLRFTIQTNAPGFLGYYANISSDKSFLLKGISSITDQELKKNVLSFLKNSDELTKTEKQKL
jgi:hypothetical protein